MKKTADETITEADQIVFQKFEKYIIAKMQFNIEELE